MALTDISIRAAKPGPKPIKIADGGGMFLLITPAGGKLWRLKYRIDGRENLGTAYWRELLVLGIIRVLL